MGNIQIDFNTKQSKLNGCNQFIFNNVTNECFCLISTEPKNICVAAAGCTSGLFLITQQDAVWTTLANGDSPAAACERDIQL